MEQCVILTCKTQSTGIQYGGDPIAQSLPRPMPLANFKLDLKANLNSRLCCLAREEDPASVRLQPLLMYPPFALLALPPPSYSLLSSPSIHLVFGRKAF